MVYLELINFISHHVFDMELLYWPTDKGSDKAFKYISNSNTTFIIFSSILSPKMKKKKSRDAQPEGGWGNCKGNKKKERNMYVK